MKVNTSMPGGLKPHYQKEVEAHREALDKNQLHQAWRHLERRIFLGSPTLISIRRCIGSC